ncbi:MAG: hypothetical protein GY714_00305 [Desulfobacterales bacterium]|nr:hypothetical protein [Desulfobacterales bacterium]
MKRRNIFLIIIISVLVGCISNTAVKEKHIINKSKKKQKIKKVNKEHKKKVYKVHKKTLTFKKYTKATTFYYLNPRPELVKNFINFIGKNNDKVLNRDTTINTIVFMNQIFYKNKSRHKKWKVIINSQNKYTKKILMKALNANPSEIFSMVNNSPVLNDMYWAAFFASGDIEFLDKLTGNLINTEERLNILTFLAGYNAKHSLAGNCKTHKSVLKYLIMMKIKADKKLKKIVNEIIKKKPKTISNEMLKIIKEQKSKGIW